MDAGDPLGLLVLVAALVGLWSCYWTTTRLTEANADRAALVAMTRERDYWRERAERLLDGALMRKGEASGPVMADTPSQAPVDRAVAQFAGLAMTEIDSART